MSRRTRQYEPRQWTTTDHWDEVEVQHKPQACSGIVWSLRNQLIITAAGIAAWALLAGLALMLPVVWEVL